jgi:DNA-binding NtrC family response regulator
MKIFLLSSDNEIIETLQKYSKKSGDDFEMASDVDTAKEMISSGDYDAVLMDCSIRASVLIGLAVDLYVILVETVVLLIGPLSREQRDQLSHRLLAHYSIDKPLRGKAFNDMMRRISMRSKIVRKAGLIGRSAAMEETIQTIIQISPTPISVLVTGESGTGKEVIARAVHYVSQRADKPFFAVNCASLAEGILESELFGHEKGSFTGAAARRIGMFEQVHGGTIFLDEIGEIPHSTQIRLLRVLEEREIMRVGGTEIIPVDVRVIAATNRNLAELVENGSFRRDLYYRIKVLEIKVPTLQDRPDDIPMLLERMARMYANENKFTVRHFSDGAKEYLSRMRWSGNVRELKNFTESCLALTSGPVINLEDIPQYLLNELTGTDNLPVKSDVSSEQLERELIYRTLLDLKNDVLEIKDMLKNTDMPVKSDNSRELEIKPVFHTSETLESMERQAIIDALDQTNRNRRKAAELLGIGERTLYRKLKLYGIE